MAGYFKECFMLKKYIIFGSVVLLLAALFTLSGCSQATNSDGGTAAFSENHLFGSATADDVARAVASAKSSGRAVVLTDQLTITGSTTGLFTVANFEDRPVRVEGTITVTGNVIVNAALANLSFAEGARINVTTAAAFIYSGNGENIYTAANNSGFKVKYVANPLEGAQGTDARIAIPSYQLKANFTDVAPHVTHLYVVDKVTLDSASVAGTGAAGSPQIIALGEVDLTGNVTAFSTVGVANFIFTAKSILTSSVPGNVKIVLPSSAGLGTVKATTPITIEGSTAAFSTFTIAKIEGPETVTISAVTSIANLSITEVAESGKVVINTPTIPAGASAFAITKNNAGTITVNASTSIAGGVVVENNTGTISFNTPIFGNGGLNIPTPTTGTGKNTGSIVITATATTGAFIGPVTVDDNAGSITIDTLTIGAIVDIKRNTGEVKFPKDLSVGANMIKSAANNGTINFQGTLTTTGLFGGASPDSIVGSGEVVFDDLATFGAFAVVIDCDTVFNGGLSMGSAALSLGGDVTLAYGKKITLTNAASITTLKAGKRILVAETPVLAAGNADVVLTPVATAALTAGDPFDPNTDDETYLGDKTLTLGAAKITSYTGDLRVVDGGVFEIGVADGLTVSGANTLTLEEGAILAFANNAAGNTYNVAFGDTKIIGVNNNQSRLIASDGPVVLGVDKISGSGSTLSVVADFGAAAITVDKTAGNANLNIAGANIDLLNNGSLTINGHGTSANKVSLVSGTNPGKITLGDSAVSSTKDFTGKTINCAAYDPEISGNGFVWGDIDEGTGLGPIGYITGAQTGGNLIITGNGGGATNAAIIAGVDLQ
jgi:hypothetical protein